MPIDTPTVQVWRTRGDPCQSLYDMLKPKCLAEMPLRLQSAAAYHIGIDVASPPADLLREIRRDLDPELTAMIIVPVTGVCYWSLLHYCH